MNAAKKPEEVDEMDQRRKWYLNRGISVDTLITMMLIVASFVAWASRQEGRMVTHEDAVKHLAEMDVATLQRMDRERAELREDMRELKAQVQLLVERKR